jgi:hypothetical protein
MANIGARRQRLPRPNPPESWLPQIMTDAFH